MKRWYNAPMKTMKLLSVCVSVCCLSAAAFGAKLSKSVPKGWIEDFEAALNAGEDLTGKTVTFTILEVHPDSVFGYNLYGGEHLNFCSSKNPGVKTGDTITVKVKEVNSLLGSWIISYTKIK